MPHQLKLYNMWISSCSFRIRMALEYLNVKYDYMAVDLFNKDSIAKAKKEGGLLGTKQVPCLQVIPKNNEVSSSLSQSMAIMQFLDADYNKLFPSDPLKKAQVIEIAEIQNSYMQPLQNVAVLFKLEDDFKKVSPDGKSTFNKLDWNQTWCLKGLEATEELICDEEDGKFCVSDEITAADLFLYPMVVNCLTRHEITLEKFPKIEKVMRNMKELEFVKKAHPFNQVDTPKGIGFGGLFFLDSFGKIDFFLIQSFEKTTPISWLTKLGLFSDKSIIQLLEKLVLLRRYFAQDS